MRRVNGAGVDPGGRDAPMLLAVSGLGLRREDRQILRRVDLAVGSGEVHAVLGPNGAGKSSFAYALIGCPDYAPDEGSIVFGGRDVTGSAMTERARLGLTLAWQEPARFEGLLVRDYIGLGMAEPDVDRIVEALITVALAPGAYLDRPVDRTLSGGERKRIELASVFAMQPKLAILDEPDSGIDVLSLDDVTAVIRRMAEVGRSVLLITHRDEMAASADSASLMCQGTVVMSGDPGEVRAFYARSCRAHVGALGSQPWPSSFGPRGEGET